MYIEIWNMVRGFNQCIYIRPWKTIGGWIAWTFFKNPDCGCERRKDYLDNLFGCRNGIKL